MKPLRLIFAGTPDFAAAQLQALIDNGQHDIVAVYSQPDRKSGRGKKLKATPVKQIALDNNIPVYQPTSLKDQTAQQQLHVLEADLMVVVAYGMLLPQQVLDIPQYGCINIHASLLPRWRGAAPIERAIEAGDSETGITVMQMDKGLDTGDMLLKQTLEIHSSDTGDSLRERMSSMAAAALLTVLEQICQASVRAEAQNTQLATYANKLNKAEAKLDWQQSAQLLALKIRAFNASNVCYSQLQGERIKVWLAEPVGNVATDFDITSPAEPGTILSADKTGIHVACGTGVLRLMRLQLPGGKQLSCADILNSKAALLQPGKQFQDSGS